MSEPLREHRSPPDEIRRTTASGADQLTLAWTARRDASDSTFREIELYEAEVRILREEAAWLEGHSVTRTVRWVRSRIFIMASFVVTAMALITWSFYGANGRATRIGWARALQVANDSTLVQIDGSALIIRDIPQREIDSVVNMIRQDELDVFGR